MTLSLNLYKLKSFTLIVTYKWKLWGIVLPSPRNRAHWTESHNLVKCRPPVSEGPQPVTACPVQMMRWRWCCDESWWCCIVRALLILNRYDKTRPDHHCCDERGEGERETINNQQLTLHLILVITWFNDSPTDAALNYTNNCQHVKR